MWQALYSELDLAVQSGFLYAPLLFDPGIEIELHAAEEEGASKTGPENGTIEVNGTIFIKTVTLKSLVDSYERIDPSSCTKLRSDLLQEHSDILSAGRIFLSGKLKTIIFEIMPYFIRKGRARERRVLSEEKILDVINEKADIPGYYYEEAKNLLDTASVWKVLQNLEAQNRPIEPPDDGLLSARDLLGWLRKAWQAKMVEYEIEWLRQMLSEREHFGTKQQYVAIVLYIAETGSLEIDDFGFSRIGSSDEYFIYKHTGEYTLKDYYARPYLFPDCRVAVSTNGVIKPIVIERYKHPFLPGYESGQEICMRGFTPNNTFAADNVIEALEEGINALLYGYDSRWRNGYYSLDRTTQHVRSVDFDDYRI
jgi:hypothetical protein